MNRLHSCFLLSAFALATITPGKGPIQIKAGLVSIQQSSHLNLFKQHVEMDQDHQHLRAEWLEVTTDEQNQLTKAIAKGDSTHQAHVWSTQKSDKPPLHAYANIIQYFPQENLIVLIGNARLLQGENSFSAPKITYNTETQHIMTQGNEQTTIILERNHDHFIR